MRRQWAWIALIAALTGSPLRQVEAAEDLARSLAELAHHQGVESVDGGVGDEADVATWRATSGPLAAVATAPGPAAGVEALSTNATGRPATGATAAAVRAEGDPGAEASRRRARLQVYRC
jgi:hypothetical protein